MTLGEALRAEAGVLEENRILSPRLTAEVLLAHAIGADRAHLYAHSEDILDEAIRDHYRSFIARRVLGEPLQYITGIQEFYGRAFGVNPSVLIPRPETEFLVEAVVELNKWSAPRIIDVGTGSGCVAISLSLEIPDALVNASDISVDAVKTARDNATRLGAEVLFACGDSLTAWSGPFEAIVSNPPYVAAQDREGLQREVRDFEPELALFGTLGPFDLYRRLLSEAEGRLVSGGILAIEIGYSMEAAILALFGPAWELLPTRADLQGIPRVVAARKR